jgi:transcriptional regulator with XRE-family HTH domain
VSTENGVSIIQLVPSQTRSSAVLSDVSVRFRATRAALGLTAQQLADQIGVTRSAVTNWEAGIRLPDPGAMIRLYERHGVTTDWVYTGNPRGLPYELALKLVDNPGNPQPARRREG